MPAPSATLDEMACAAACSAAPQTPQSTGTHLPSIRFELTAFTSSGAGWYGLEGETLSPKGPDCLQWTVGSFEVREDAMQHARLASKASREAIREAFQAAVDLNAKAAKAGVRHGEALGDLLLDGHLPTKPDPQHRYHGSAVYYLVRPVAIEPGELELPGRREAMATLTQECIIECLEDVRQRDAGFTLPDLASLLGDR